MADPVLHIKDSYFFEVPKFMWHPKYKSMLDVPDFLEAAHPEITDAAEFEHAMAGKILIPQPFGTLENLYERKSGFAISRFMILEVVAAVLLYFVFKKFAAIISSKEPPKGKWNNAIESVVLFIRNDIARQAIAHHPDHYVPVLGTLFFFILTLNLLGMIPFLGAATGAFAVTLPLAFFVWMVGFLAGTRELGPVGFWTNMVPHIEMPMWMFPLKWAIILMLFIIEVFGMVIKHTVLGFRLLANMVAGHLVLVSILGMVVAAASAATGVWATTAVSGVLGASLLSVMELGVAFLQAFVFTFLSALFINMASHAH
jgi:F-type H+-transporting ATPase subunit a